MLSLRPQWCEKIFNGEKTIVKDIGIVKPVLRKDGNNTTKTGEKNENVKKILMSIKPHWAEKIFTNIKIIEVRKTAPKIDTPFEVLVYETKGKTKYWSQPLPIPYTEGSGKVIGSFVCDRIDKYTFSNYEARYRINDVDIAKTCLTHPELIAYGKGKPIYGWHITEPKLFDKPRDITEFALYGRCAEDCDEYDICARDSEDGRMSCKYFKRTFLERPPQSYCFVETDEK